MTKKPGKRAKPFSLDMTFEEALRRFAMTDPEELSEAMENVREEVREVDRYAEERQKSIRKGARRDRS